MALPLQGHDGMNYSACTGDMMTNMIEVHGMASGFDGGMFVASCDKAVPTILMGIGRLKDIECYCCYRRCYGSPHDHSGNM